MEHSDLVGKDLSPLHPPASKALIYLLTNSIFAVCLVVSARVFTAQEPMPDHRAVPKNPPSPLYPLAARDVARCDENPLPQLVCNQFLPAPTFAVTPISPLESALTQIAGCHPLFLSLLNSSTFNFSTFFNHPLCFHILGHSFALTKITTLFFSSNSALFAKNTRGGVGCLTAQFQPASRETLTPSQFGTCPPHLPWCPASTVDACADSSLFCPLSIEDSDPVGTVDCQLLPYLLISSLASRRFSSGSRNCLFWAGAVLIAWVISLAAAGKSPLLESMRASARWLIQ
jgi:hypothetical protein